MQAAAPNYGAPPAMMYVPRVQRHVQTLGILWCVYGAYRAFAGIIAALFLFGISTGAMLNPWGAHTGFPFMQMPWMASFGWLIAVLLLCLSALSFAVGFSLMTRKPWGRTLAIVVAILSLIKIPFGTALGIYTLWVLAPAASGAEWDAIADRT